MISLLSWFAELAWYQQCILTSLSAIFGLQIVIVLFAMSPVVIKESFNYKLGFIDCLFNFVFSVIFIILSMVPLIGSLIVFMSIEDEKWFKLYMACSMIVFIAGVIGTSCSNI